MLKKDGESLNGKNDWLSEEIKREGRVSAWDFDLKERQKVQKEYANDSVRQEDLQIKQINSNTTKLANNQNNEHFITDYKDEREEIISGDQSDKRKASIRWLAISSLVLIIMAIFNKVTGIRTSFAVLALYMFLYPVSFVYGIIYEKLLPARYLITVTVIALLMELIDLISIFGK